MSIRIKSMKTKPSQATESMAAIVVPSSFKFHIKPQSIATIELLLRPNVRQGEGGRYRLVCKIDRTVVFVDHKFHIISSSSVGWRCYSLLRFHLPNVLVILPTHRSINEIYLIFHGIREQCIYFTSSPAAAPLSHSTPPPGTFH